MGDSSFFGVESSTKKAVAPFWGGRILRQTPGRSTLLGTQGGSPPAGLGNQKLEGAALGLQSGLEFASSLLFSCFCTHRARRPEKRKLRQAKQLTRKATLQNPCSAHQATKPLLGPQSWFLCRCFISRVFFRLRQKTKRTVENKQHTHTHKLHTPLSSHRRPLC